MSDNEEQTLRKPKKVLQVAIIDDNGYSIKDFLDNTIECEITVISIKAAYENLEKGNFDFFSRFDMLFFDGTYNENGIRSIDIMEKLLRKKPEFSEKTTVLIGTDIKKYGPKDPFVGPILQDIEEYELPCTIYGNIHGSKTQVMIYFIDRIARKKGDILPRKLSDGICRAVILQKVSLFLNIICQLAIIQKNTSDVLKIYFNETNATTDAEIKLNELGMKIAELFLENGHTVNNLLAQLHMFSLFAQDKSDENEAQECDLYIETNWNNIHKKSIKTTDEIDISSLITEILDLLEKKDISNLINKTLKLQEKLGLYMQAEFEGIKPTNESERLVLRFANELSQILINNYHVISNQTNLLKTLIATMQISTDNNSVRDGNYL